MLDGIGEAVAEVVAGMFAPEGDDSSTTPVTEPPPGVSRRLQILFTEGVELELIEMDKDGRVLSRSKGPMKLKFDRSNTEHNANE